MNMEFIAKWTAALRSGKYQQGTNHLKYVDNEHNVRHCCLGVACELAIDSGMLKADWEAPPEKGGTPYGLCVPREDLGGSIQVRKHYDYLPGELADMLSLNRSGDFRFPITVNGRRELFCSLSSMNDRGVPFEVIAEVIDKWSVQGNLSTK